MAKKISDNNIHKICHLIEEGVSNKNISIMLNIHSAIISSIRRKLVHLHISKDYDLTKKPIVCREAEIRQICKLIEDGKKNIDIHNITGFSVNMISAIRNSVIYTNISKEFKITVKPKKHNEEIIHKICQLIDKGQRNIDISNYLNCHPDLVSVIRRGIYHTEISKDYEFMNTTKIITEKDIEIAKIKELIEQGMTNAEIHRNTNYSLYRISSVRNNRYKDKVNIDKKYDDETENKIRKICELIEDKKSNSEISSLLNCNKNYISKVRQGRMYRSISKDYDITVKPEIINEDKIREVCELIQSGKRNNEISSISNFTVYSISQIRNRVLHKNISKDYIFPSNTKITKKNISVNNK